MNQDDFDTLDSDEAITEISLKISAQDIRNAYQMACGLDEGLDGKKLNGEQISRTLAALLRAHKMRMMPVVNWSFIGNTAKRIASA